MCVVGDSHGVYSVVCIGCLHRLVCEHVFIRVGVCVSIWLCLSVSNASVGLVFRCQVLLL